MGSLESHGQTSDGNCLGLHRRSTCARDCGNTEFHFKAREKGRCNFSPTLVCSIIFVMALTSSEMFLSDGSNGSYLEECSLSVDEMVGKDMTDDVRTVWYLLSSKGMLLLLLSPEALNQRAYLHHIQLARHSVPSQQFP